jgi:hypothetical protein
MKKLAVPPVGSLLLTQLTDVDIHHQDTFVLTVSDDGFKNQTASTLLLQLLGSFVSHPPTTVTWLMKFRNVMVKPLGLRTSHLGCPVSSLISKDERKKFHGVFPVLEQQVNESDTHAQVVLGANDKHLIFRSCVGVALLNDNAIELSLGTRVHCNNAFGRFYMSAIDLVHRHYISPLMLNHAANSLRGTS